MKHFSLIQKGLSQTASIKGHLESELALYRSYDRVYIAMAYITVAGVRNVLGLLSSLSYQSQWLFGLDDSLSQPGAIELCLSLAKSQVRVASFEKENRRFHPKILYIFDSKHPFKGMMMLGSANMTKNALSRNAESIIILYPESNHEKIELENIWNDTWQLGRLLLKGELERYKTIYKKNISSRKDNLKYRVIDSKKLKHRKTHLILEDDEAQIDPSNATVCWIECGNVTAMGRELELKSEQGLFFDLNPHGGSPRYLNFTVSNGKSIQLRMKYQGNHMWRLQMTNEVPEVAKGLRPMVGGRLTRSPWVAVFERSLEKDAFRLSFIRLGSKEFARLRALSVSKGTLGNTTAREYGWY